jgi:hypothetical protein
LHNFAVYFSIRFSPQLQTQSINNHALLSPPASKKILDFLSTSLFKDLFSTGNRTFFYDIPAYPSHHSLFRASFEGCLSSRTPSKIVEIFWEYPIPWELWKASEKDFSFLAFRRYLASAVAALPLHDKSSEGEGIANLP